MNLMPVSIFMKNRIQIAKATKISTYIFNYEELDMQFNSNI